MENTQNIGTESVRWDLSVFYKGIDDPQIDKDLVQLVEGYKKFSENYKGHLAEKLGGAISEMAEISMWSNKIFGYIFLLQSLDVNNAKVNAKMAAAQQIISEAGGNYLSFFEIELVALGDEVIQKLSASDPIVSRHIPWIEHIRVFKDHLLTEPVEAALAKRSPFLSGSWSQFFDEVESDLEFPFHNERKNLSEILNILATSTDAAVRAEALQIINDGFSGYFSKYCAQTLYMVVGASAVERRERNYKNPMEGRNKSNRIPDDVVDALHTAVIQIAGPLAQRYYKLKAELLGIETLAWSDRNALMPFADNTKVPFDSAKGIVLNAYKSFSPTLGSLAEAFFTEHRIDAHVEKGKQRGGYNASFILPENKSLSFVFVNYLGSNNNVQTLAHELGHGVHGMLANKAQGPLMSDVLIAYAETASVFGEAITFNFLKSQLKQRGDTKALLALIIEKIDATISTVVRQIGFSNFERRIHGMDASYKTWQEPKKLSAEELDEIWMDTIRELYGKDGDVFTYKNAARTWTYVSHFHRPFYVYGYAFGELLTQSLYAQQARLKDQFEPLYLDLLRSGSTKNVTDLLAPFGLDPSKKDFWESGITVGLGALIEEAEALAKQI